MTDTDFNRYFEVQNRRIDAALKRYLPKNTIKPTWIHQAMNYSIFAGGKRLRPILVIAGAELCGLSWKKVIPAACALELIHTYSLIHDDLPAMDDDDLRRGRPTNHIVFGEDMAILAGDALLTHAFSLLADTAKTPGIDAKNVVNVIRMVAHHAGTRGMIGGQVADVKADMGRWKNRKNREYTSPSRLLKFIHENKTAALIRASLLTGAILAGATSSQRRALDVYGQNLGLAFQVADDILDRIGDKKKLGKRGSDTANQKLTYPALFGLEASKKMAQSLITKAHQAIHGFGPKAAFLHSLADFVVHRDH